MGVTSFPTFFDQYIYPLILMAIGAFLGALFNRWMSKKKKKLREETDVKIQSAHKGIIGELRQGDRSQVVIVNEPTYALSEVLVPRTKPTSILKRDKKITSLIRPSERKREISGVQFTFIRDLTDKVFEDILWLPEDFDRALQAAIGYYSSGMPIDSNKYSEQMLHYFEDMEEMHENDRLTHLIIPRMILLDRTDLSAQEKWALLHEYFNGVKAGVKEPLGNMIFVAGKDPQVYVDALLHEYHETRKLDHIIIEARGRYINNAALAANLFVYQNMPYWFITRTDFCLHAFEETEHAAKIWIEVSKAADEEVAVYLDRQNKMRSFVKSLREKSDIHIEKREPLQEKEERKKLYSRIEDDLYTSGVAVIVGEGDLIDMTLFLASVFRNYNPKYDYAADLDISSDAERRPRVTVIFGSEDISSLFHKFVEKENS